MPKRAKLENNNTAVRWRIKDRFTAMDPESYIFRDFEKGAVEDYNEYIGFAHEKEAAGNLEGLESTKNSLKDVAWDLALQFATNWEKPYTELYYLLQKGWGVEANPLVADLILAVGVEFENEKALKLAKEVGLEVDEDLEIAALKLSILIGKIGNNLSMFMIVADAVACLDRVDRLMQEELAEITGNPDEKSLIDCLADKDDLYAALYADYKDYMEIVSDEIHPYQNHALFGNAGFFAKLFGCCCSSAPAESDAA